MKRNNSPFSQDRNDDMGFGSAGVRDETLRLLNRDGTFNARRQGLHWIGSTSVYEHLIRITWGHFYVGMVLTYLAINLVFATAYFALGPEAIRGLSATSPLDRFLQAFFLSVQSLTTVGYGVLTPRTVTANLIMSLEALVGLGGFAVMAALIFARLSRPTAEVRFSPTAVIGPYRGGEAFMFRIANARRGEILDAWARVNFSWVDRDSATPVRRFAPLELEANHIVFFPLHWTIVHRITPDSPLAGWDHERLRSAHAEFLIQVSATSETYADQVRVRSSYTADEIEWGGRFADILDESKSGVIGVDVRRLGDLERAP
ncbi:MAG: ion channel [Gemmatimonadetes bacterium]|nr:ion channel [Gemmatimonadota bacterium]